MRFISILFFSLFFTLIANGQGMYRTVEGKVEIRGEGKDGGLVARSGELLVRVDYESGELFMNLDQGTLRTGIDSIDALYREKRDDQIRFEGKLKRGGFDPNHCYSASPLRIEGDLSYRGVEQEIEGTGQFESRFSNDLIPCMIEITFDIELSDSKWAAFLPGFQKDVRLRIVQALLSPSSN